MILEFDDYEEFQEFARNYSKERYRLYFESKTSHWILRPKKSSKNLDTAIFTGDAPEELVMFLEKQFDDAIRVKEFLHTRE